MGVETTSLLLKANLKQLEVADDVGRVGEVEP